jgi:iron complex transport system ATP-binding protein
MTARPPPPLEVEALRWGRPGRPFGGPWSLRVEAGEAVAVLGPNGAGKTTLFRTLIGALPPLSGTVRWEGRSPGEATPAQLAASVAFVPQLGPGAAGLTAGEYVMLGRLARKPRFAGPSGADHEAVTRALAHLGLDGLADRPLHRLSGGEQLAAIARALAQQARVLVLDEPTASLDFGNQARVLGHLEALTREGFALLFSTHQPEHAQRLAGRVLAIDGCGHMRFGTAAEVLTGEVLSQVYGVTVERIDRAGRDPAFVAGGR